MEVIPSNVAPVMLGPWHATHPLVTPLWLYCDLLNLAEFCTGSVRLELTPTWQLSQGVVPKGTCLAGGATIVNPLAGMAKLTAAVVL
jgi:hypothetical protein